MRKESISMKENELLNTNLSETISASNSALKKRTRKSPKERLAEIEEQQRQLLEKKKKLEAEIKTADRKARTKHLIEVGAAFVKTLSDLNISEEDIPAVLAFLKQQETSGNWVSKAIAKSKNL